MNKNYTINDFRADYPNEDACLNKVFSLVTKNLKCCPKCRKRSEFKRVNERRCYRCVECHYQLYPTKGTIFEKTTTPLTVWFYTMFLFAKSKNGLSACELERQTGVNYKTAWRILMKIRGAVETKDVVLSGVVEMDETFVGGKNKNRHFDKKVEGSQGRSFKDKTPVFGMLQRGGNVAAYVVANTKAESLVPIALSKVEKGSHIHTDEWEAYNGLNKLYKREFVYHRKGEYANGDVTTNRIENFWSVFKRTINGSYIRVSPKYLQQYVNEVVYRYNNRDKDVFAELLEVIFSAA